MEKAKLKVGIIGGGAVGLTYACFLAGVADVLVKTRGQAQADNIKASGIGLTRAGKTINIKGIDASASMGDLKDCDVIIIAVKSYDTENIAKELSSVIKPDALVVSLQNGIQALDILKANIANPQRVFAGVTYVGVRRTDDHSISLGQFTRTVLDSNATALIEALQATEYGAEVSTDIRQTIWDKMVLNTGQNALSAVSNLSARQMLASADCVDRATKILDEFSQVAKAEGLSFEGSLIDKVTTNWGGGDDFYPSMWQDLYAGKRTEIDAINGAISELGRKHGIPTPFNNAITAEVKAGEQKSQPTA